MSRKDRLREISHDQYWDNANQVDWRTKGENNIWDMLLDPSNGAFNPQNLDLNALQKYNPTAYNPTGLRDDELKDLNLGRISYQNLGDLPTLRRSDPNGYNAAQVGSIDAINQMMSGQGLPQGVLNLLQNKAAETINAGSDAAMRNVGANLAARGFGDSGGLTGDALLKAQMDRGNQLGNAAADIYTQNAMIGNQNRQVGTGMELSRQGQNAAMTNQARAMGYGVNNAANMAEYAAQIQRQKDINDITNRERDVNLQQGNQEANTNLQNYYQRKYYNLGLRNQADQWNAQNANEASKYNASNYNNAMQYNSQENARNNQSWINTMMGRAQAFNPLGWESARQGQFGALQTEFTRPGWFSQYGMPLLGAAVGGLTGGVGGALMGLGTRAAGQVQVPSAPRGFGLPGGQLPGSPVPSWMLSGPTF